MDSLTPKKLMMIALVALGCFAIKQFTVSDETNIDQVVDKSYEMIRPKAFSKDFSLDDREVDYKIIDRRAKKQAKVVAPAKPFAPKKPVQPAAKPVAAQPKKKENKKSQLAPPMMMVQTTPAEQKAKAPAMGGSDSTPVAAAGAGGGADDTPNQNPVTKEEWKNLLLSKPTNENMTRFLNAYSAGQVTKADFYEIIDVLLQNNGTESQTIGLRGLAVTPSLESYTMLVHYYKEARGDMQGAAGKVVGAYTDPSRFTILEQALASNDAVVLMQTTSVIDHAVTKSKVSKEQISQSRDGRGVASGYPNYLFAKFIPLLQRLTSSENSTLSSSASNLISSIDNQVTI